ncbi:hypothetical protein M408DRAFT_159487 [Serendipita vermifera MAFF 305830]|uniref:Uncharacterized protein n=1 Tax=Serendipita vermifera MAFF 305830 TaxID=933852 RepID=A0A0C3B6P3_SERVB|nr:hypothetical protein M408DRAFT_159487 [Serendipita vermifera MAFF 305830]
MFPSQTKTHARIPALSPLILVSSPLRCLEWPPIKSPLVYVVCHACQCTPKFSRRAFRRFRSHRTCLRPLTATAAIPDYSEWVPECF